MDLWSYYSLHCLGLHKTDTQHPEYFQQPVLISSFSLKQLVSARMQRLRDCWCSTMQTPTIAAIEDGPLSTRLSPEMTWRSSTSLWKGVPRLSQQMPTGSPPYLWQLRVGSWKLWDILQDVVSTALHASIHLILNSEFPNNSSWLRFSVSGGKAKPAEALKPLCSWWWNWVGSFTEHGLDTCASSAFIHGHPLWDLVLSDCIS